MISGSQNVVILAVGHLLLCTLLLTPAVQGHGGIRRRAWGRVHMLRSGKRSDVPPLPQEQQQTSGDILLPLLANPDLLAARTDFYNKGLPQFLADDEEEEGNFEEKFPALEDSFGDDQQPGEIKFLDDVSELPEKRGYMYQRRPAWGGAHMLRSGKRAGMWEGHSRPRWGGAHMLRSGRSDPSMQEMIENMNNGRTTNII